MNDQQYADQVGAALVHQVAGIHTPPLSLADVESRARGIRRRRRALATGTVAAALAVVVPSALLLGGTSDRADAPAPAGPAPVTTAPAASVLQGSTLTHPDGSTVELELSDDQVQGYGVLTDGRVVLAAGSETGIEVFGPDGIRAASYPAALNHVVLGPTAQTAAWIGDDGAVRVLEAGVPEPTVLATPPSRRSSLTLVDAVLGTDCADGGCRVLVGDGSTTTHEVTLEAAKPFDLGEPVRVSDVSPDGGLWAYSEPPGRNAQYGCVGLYDVATASTTARSCETYGLSFSPDGRYLDGAFAENNMLGNVQVLDLSLEPVLAYEPGKDRVVSRTGWASPDSLLVSVGGFDNRWSLLEVPVDGSAPTTVAGPVAGENPEFGAEFLPSS